MDRRHFLGSSLTAAAVAASLPYERALAQAPPAAAADSLPAEISAITGRGVSTTLSRADLDALRQSLRGSLLLPGNPGYDEARRVIVDTIDLHPALVVQPTGAADVRTAVNFARSHELLLAIKCGGHNQSGLSTCEGGMQLDLSRMRGVRVDPQSRVAYVAGGSLLGDLDHEAMANGLVTTAGTVSHTGVGGLTLGGGFGRLARRFGLAADNVHAVDVVTADGRFLHASERENSDLLWAVRGGGGNFGVVTAFEFGLHPMQRQVVAGNLVFPIARARELLASYGDYTLHAPDEMYADCILSAAPGKDPVFVISICYSGPPDRVDQALAPLRKLGTPLADTFKPVDYVQLQRRGDRTDPRTEDRSSRSGFVDTFDSKLAAALIDGFEPRPDRKITIFFQHVGGAIGRVPRDATAFPQRLATHNMLPSVAWPLGTDPAAHVRYFKEYWASLSGFTDGFYSNEGSDEPRAVIEANFQGNLKRLQHLKSKYDPGNLFRLNANISPSA